MRVLAALGRALAASAVQAQDFSFVPNPQQADFEKVSKDVVGVLGYKALGPAEAGGVTGFSIGAYGAYSSTQDSGAWRRLTGEDVDAVGVVGLSARKGLPFGFDIGVDRVGAVVAVVKPTRRLVGGSRCSARSAAAAGPTAPPAAAVVSEAMIEPRNTP